MIHPTAPTWIHLTPERVKLSGNAPSSHPGVEDGGGCGAANGKHKKVVKMKQKRKRHSDLSNP